MPALPRNPAAVERLEKVAGTTNGFDLARIDLEQRKEGDVLGTAQSGRLTRLRLLRVIRDEHVIEQAREDAGTSCTATRPWRAPRTASHDQPVGDRWRRVRGEGVTRIIAGAARGRRLAVPATGTRPTADRVRGSLLVLDRGDGPFRRARAGSVRGLRRTGVPGALTRCSRVTSGGQQPAAVQVMRRNVATVGLPGVHVVKATATGHLRGQPQPVDLVLLDPVRSRRGPDRGNSDAVVAPAGWCGEPWSWWAGRPG